VRGLLARLSQVNKTNLLISNVREDIFLERRKIIDLLRDKKINRIIGEFIREFRKEFLK
jgi:hypothetical protein